MTDRIPDVILREAWRVYHEHHHNIATAADYLEITPKELRARLREGKKTFGDNIAESHIKGSIKTADVETLPLPARGKIKTYMFSLAQSNTRLYDKIWENGLALAKHYDARIFISRNTYNKGSYRSRNVKVGKGPTVADSAPVWFDPRIEPYISDARVEVAPGLMWMGDAQIIVTQKWPLTRFETAAGRKSLIVPHTTVQMKSVVSAKFEPTKLLYSTGAVTQRNYIARNAGYHAEQHHSYGFLLVEVDWEGNWYARQIQGGPNGEIYDVGREADGVGAILAKNGKVTTGHRVEAITWGDIHAQRADKVIFDAAFGEGGMLDALKPKQQHIHDLLDFESQSHHTKKNAYEMYDLHIKGRDSVPAELKLTAECSKQMCRKWVNTVAIDSNHNRHLEKWTLGNYEWFNDLPNALIHAKLHLAKLESIASQDEDFSLCEYALRLYGIPEEILFLKRDEPLIICKSVSGEAYNFDDSGINCGMHGDDGPNGSRGTPASLSKMGRRANTAHTHTTGIYQGLYVAGTCSKLDMRFNHGPSSWSHSHIVTYPNGTRTIVTMWEGKWRA